MGIHGSTCSSCGLIGCKVCSYGPAPIPPTITEEDIKKLKESVTKAIEKEHDTTGTTFDDIDYPEHYNQGEIQCIEAMESCQGPLHEGYLHGCAFKYLWRYKYKGSLKDLRKAVWYLNRLQEFISRG